MLGPKICCHSEVVGCPIVQTEMVQLVAANTVSAQEFLNC